MSKHSHEQKRRPYPLRKYPVLPKNTRLLVEPDRLEIVYSNRNWVMGIAVGLFLTFWTSSILKVLCEMIFRETSSAEFLFMIPFVLVSVFLFCLTLRCFLHRETLRLDASGLDWQFFICFVIRHRHVSWEQLVSIQKGYRYINGGYYTGWGAAVETKSKTFPIFHNMDYRTEGRALQEQEEQQTDTFNVQIIDAADNEKTLVRIPTKN